METPYGDIPDNLAKGMQPQEMHDFLQKRYGRRSLFKGAAAASALAAAGPVFWRQADAFASPRPSSVGAPSTPPGAAPDTFPQWVAYGPDPATSYWVSWSAGNAFNPVLPAQPLLQYADSLSELEADNGQIVYPSVNQVPLPNSALYGTPPANTSTASFVDLTYYVSALIEDLTPDTTYWYKVSIDGKNWIKLQNGTFAYFATAQTVVHDFTFAATGDENEIPGSTDRVVASILAYNPKFTIVAGDLSYSGGGVETLGKTYGQPDPAPGTSYASTVTYSPNTSIPDGTGTSIPPSSWNGFFGFIAEAAQYIPWIVGVGNHEMEPLTAAGYAGVLTRFPDLAQAANGGSTTEVKGSSFVYRGQSFTWNGYQVKDGTRYYTGSPVVRSFTYGNVAFIQLDGNDLSSEIANNNGYTDGQQTSWLVAKLAEYRAEGSGVDFVLVYFHNCPYCSNSTHGSDAGIRNVWQPIFDRFNVDLVINGHVHAYERTNPLNNNVVQQHVASGGSYTNYYNGGVAHRAPRGSISATTYICAGGGGQTLYDTWYGVSDQDGPAKGNPAADKDPNAGVAAAYPLGPDERQPQYVNAYQTSTTPFTDVWEVGGEVEAGSATGAPSGISSSEQYSGGPEAADPAYDASDPYSAFRFSTWSHLVINVKAPTRPGDDTSLEILSVDANVSPTVVQDSVTIVRKSVVDTFGRPGF